MTARDENGAAMMRPGAWHAGGPLARGFFCLVLLFGGAGLWATTTQLSGAVIASGKISVEARRQVVQHPDGGVVSEILAKDGDRVSAGQVLLRLDGAADEIELAIVEADRHEIWARIARLEAERDDLAAPLVDDALKQDAASDAAVAEIVAGQARLLAARRDSWRREAAQLSERQVQIDAEIEGYDAQRAANAIQRRLIAGELSDQKGLLKKGLAQASRVLALERNAAELDGRLGALKSRAAQARGRRAEIEIEKLRLAAGRRETATEELRAAKAEFRRLSEQRDALLSRLERLELRAPRDGVVIESVVHAPRMVLRAAEPALFVVPGDDRLVVEARIPPQEIDRVHAGQPATLRFPAFEAEKTPEIMGVVAQISADAIEGEPNEPSFYLARIDLPESALALLGDRSLTPGMPVDAYLATSARTPLSFILKPATDFFDRAFRER